jgi:hypothetical protein
MTVKPDEIFKTNSLKLASFLIARGCLLKDATLNNDRRVDFYVSGAEVFSLVKEFEMMSKRTLVCVHDLHAADEHLKDKIGSLKKSARGA